MQRVAIFLLLSLQGCGYILRGAWEEVKILARRERIEKVLNKPGVSEDMKRKLEIVLRARTFAERKGLNVGRAYSQYSELDSSSITWVVTAAPEFGLQPKTWWFPIVGRVPYKGFFDRVEAEQYAQKLKQEGFDVSVRSSSAFSTLGYFNDPVLSSMLKGDEVTLVDTLFHELLHRTIWVPSGVDFNESLANFIGVTLAQEFFQSLGEKELLSRATLRKNEEFAFSDFVTQVSWRLEELYAQEMPREEKLKRKAEILELARADWEGRGVSLYYSLAKYPLNNASLLALRTYLKELKLFDEVYERCGRNAPQLLRLLEQFGERSIDKSTLFDELRHTLKEEGVCSIE